VRSKFKFRKCEFLFNKIIENRPAKPSAADDDDFDDEEDPDAIAFKA
jgi:hypothetical protein